MAEEARRKPGRPRTPGHNGPGDYVGFRAPRALKEKLELAAKEAGRSLSSEAQFRLEQSFLYERVVDEAHDLIYGPELNGVLMMIGQTIRYTAGLTGFHAATDDLKLNGWLRDRTAFDEVVSGVNRIFEALRDNIDEIEPSGVLTRFPPGRGSAYADGLMQSISKPNDTAPSRASWGKSVRSKLGEFAARIDAWAKSKKALS